VPEPRYLVVGRVLRPHGVRGEVKIAIHTGYPERLVIHEFFYLSHPHMPDVVQPYPVERVRVRADVALVKFGGCDSRNDAEELRGMWVQVPVEKAAPLEPGEYYQYQLVGMSVETEGGEWLGQVADVLETGANDVYLVLGPYGEVLLPAIEEVVRTIDMDARCMVVHLLPGLLNEDIA
jgi:16S rRNA processing protein RimM